MKPLLLQVQESTETSLNIRYEKAPYFDNPWHYHPECELALVIKSTGLRFIGDSIEPFEPYDLVLLGPNLPHYWRNKDRYYQRRSESAEAIILRFRPDAWGNDFLASPELNAINSLLLRAVRGIQFEQQTARKVLPLLTDILYSQGTERMIGWLRVFTLLADAQNTRLLSKQSFGGLNAAADSGRMQQVLAYVQENLANEIRLDEVAELASMNKAAFCRYFKQQTNKTFTQVVNELRIQSACRMLLESSSDINQISFQCGFQDVSYFNQLFKCKKGTSPSEFRRAHRSS